jgi:hypothetical protein
MSAIGKLLLYSPHDIRIAVTRVHNSDTRCKVKIFVVLNIPQKNALAFPENKGKLARH